MCGDQTTEDLLQELRAENYRLRHELQEAQETIEALRRDRGEAVAGQESRGDDNFFLADPKWAGEEQARRLLLAISDTTGDVIFAKDRQGRIIFANPATLALIGKPREQVLGRTDAEFLEDKTAACQVMENDRRIMDSGVAEDLEEVVPLPDGTRRVWFSRKVPYHDGEGRVVGLLGVSRDITERKRTEEAQRRSEEKYRQLFESMSEGFLLIEMILDESGKPVSYRYLDANPALERLTHLKRQDIIGKDVREVLPGVEPYWIEAFGHVAMTGEPSHIEQFSKDLNGWYDVYVYRPERGKAALIYTNVTERKRAEETLRQSEQRYRSLFNSMTEGFAVHEIITGDAGRPVDWRFLDINPAFERMTGLKRENVVGRTHNEVLPDDDPRWLEKYGRVALGGEPVHFENYSPALQRHYEVFTYRPAPRQFAVIFMDITERKQAEEEISRLNQDLQRRAVELQTIFETAPIGLAIADDSEGLHIRGNPANERMLGVARGGELSKAGPRAAPYRCLQNGRELPVGELPMQRAIRGETVTGQVVDVIRESGQALTLYCSASPLLDDAGKPRGAVGAFLDITPLKQAEETLRASEEHYRRLFEAANDGVVLHPLGTVPDQCRFVRFNTVICRMLGYTPEEMVRLSPNTVQFSMTID
jgi:PAS domain S-box-containing protein